LPVSGVYLSSLSVVSYIRHNESRVVCSSSDPPLCRNVTKSAY
jgi:hypothetical protein